MNRNIDYIIDEDSAGLRVEQFLRRKRYSGQNLSEIKRMPKSILVNGVHYYMRQELSTGDHLQVRICETQNSEKIPPTKLPLDIIYEDEDLLVLNKPAGMPIHPSLNNYTNSIANALAYYFQSQGKPFIFRCCNRLDRDTSGLTIVSKHLVSGSILSDMTKHREVHREYLAIARGSVTPSEGTIQAPLGRKEGTIIERTVDWEHGEDAVTHYKVVKEANGHSLVSLRLETGRTHQIRIHMKISTVIHSIGELPVQPRHGVHDTSSSALPPHGIHPPDYRGTYEFHCSAARRYDAGYAGIIQEFYQKYFFNSF